MPRLPNQYTSSFRWLWVSALLFGVSVNIDVVGAVEPSPTPKALEVQPEELQRARVLVQQLGSDSYTQREQAQAELAKMGRLARIALQEALATHPSPEVRQRCASLLPTAIEDDIKTRLEVFLADSAGRYHHPLPGWEQFRAVVCNEWRWCGWTLGRNAALEPVARKLYADILRSPSNRQLLFLWEDPQSNLTSALAERRLELITWRNSPRVIINGQLVTTPQRPPDLVDWLTVLFLEQILPTNAVAAQRSPLSAALLNSAVRDALRQNNPTGEAIRNLTLGWAMSQRDPQELYYLVLNAENLGLSSQTLPLAQRLLRHPAATVAHKMQAFNRLLQQPHPRLLPLLESLFRDESTIVNMTVVRTVNGVQQRENITVQLRDAALAAALEICQISPTNYGFIDRLPQQKTPYVQSRYYFPDDKVRQQAFERWQRERPQPPPPTP
jgi:hypothetical protein